MKFIYIYLKVFSKKVSLIVAAEILSHEKIRLSRIKSRDCLAKLAKETHLYSVFLLFENSMLKIPAAINCIIRGQKDIFDE